MMATDDTELSAIRALVDALEHLDPEARGRVVAYALSRFDIRSTVTTQAAAAAPSQPADSPFAGTPDIRALKELKAPKSGNEMAALVAFYLSELAPEVDRKESITTADIKKYFKQAGFPLPKVPRVTLANARNAGYFEVTSEPGAYRLNPVGYNLVAHGLPGGGTKTGAKPKPRRTPRR